MDEKSTPWSEPTMSQREEFSGGAVPQPTGGGPLSLAISVAKLPPLLGMLQFSDRKKKWKTMPKRVKAYAEQQAKAARGGI
jgi:hypothetical protein